MTEAEKEQILHMAQAIERRNEVKRAARAARVQERKHQAQEEIERLVTLFRETDPALRRVVLFGSLATGRVRSEDFDIDLAVNSDRYMDLLGHAMDSQFKVDLVDLTAPASYIHAAIEREGKELYRA